MNLSNLIPNMSNIFKDNGPEILTAIGVTGVVSTAYLASKASVKAHELIEDDMEANKAARPLFVHTPTRKETFQLTWHLYIPVVLSGVGTIACIIIASKGNAKRTAAAVTAYSVTEKAFSEYKEKVVEQLGKGKDQKVQDAIAQDQVRLNPPTSNEIIILGNGTVLCCELYTGRYFESDMESLRKAMNEVNRWLISNRKATLNDFYDEIGLPYTDASGKLGWLDDEFMDLIFSATLTENDKPCMTFSYNYVKPLV